MINRNIQWNIFLLFSLKKDVRIQKAISCIVNQLDDAEDTYTLSVLAFALKKAGHTSVKGLLERLDKKAVRKSMNNE